VTDSATFTIPENEDEDLGEDLGDLLLEVLPPDGSKIGNLSAREALSRAVTRQTSIMYNLTILLRRQAEQRCF